MSALAALCFGVLASGKAGGRMVGRAVNRGTRPCRDLLVIGDDMSQEFSFAKKATCTYHVELRRCRAQGRALEVRRG